MSSPIVYRPCPVKLPAHLGWQRDIRVWDGDIIARNLSFDRDTLFHDVFRSPDHRKIIALGPRLRNLATRLLPLRVYDCRGRRLRYHGAPLRDSKLELYYVPGSSMHLLEIFADEEDIASDEPLELVLRWKSFEQRVVVPPNPLAALPPVTLTLYTLQKDNPLQWLRDWCLYYHRVHGVERVVLYDNGSADAAVLPEHLASLDAGLQVIVVDWNFPYGNHINNACQSGSLNHCHRIFGDRSVYYLNFDIDEYLVNPTSQPLSDYLGKHLTGKVVLLEVPEIPVPNVVRTGDRPAGVVDFSVRYKPGSMPAGRPKTIFRHKGVRQVMGHGCYPEMSKVGLLIERLKLIWQSLHFRYGVWVPRYFFEGVEYQIRLPGCYLYSERSDLYHKHYRGLSTGWKEADHPARHSVAFDPAIHEADTEMQQLFEKHGIGR